MKKKRIKIDGRSKHKNDCAEYMRLPHYMCLIICVWVFHMRDLDRCFSSYCFLMIRASFRASYVPYNCNGIHTHTQYTFNWIDNNIILYWIHLDVSEDDRPMRLRRRRGSSCSWANIDSINIYRTESLWNWMQEYGSERACEFDHAWIVILFHLSQCLLFVSVSHFACLLVSICPFSSISHHRVLR